MQLFEHPDLQQITGTLDIRCTPGMNYEQAPTGYAFVGAGNAYIMINQSEASISYWKNVAAKAKGYIGFCAGAVLATPVDNWPYTFPGAPRYPADTAPVLFSEACYDTPLVQQAVPVVANTTCFNKYFSVGNTLETIHLNKQWEDPSKRDEVSICLDIYNSAIFGGGVPRRHRQIFDAWSVRSKMSEALQISLDSVIFDVSKCTYGEIDLLASLTPNNRFGLDAKRAFAYVDHRTNGLYVGGHPEAVYKDFDNLYSQCQRADFNSAPAAKPLIDNIDNAREKSLAQSIQLVGEGIKQVVTRARNSASLLPPKAVTSKIPAVPANGSSAKSAGMR